MFEEFMGDAVTAEQTWYDIQVFRQIDLLRHMALVEQQAIQLYNVTARQIMTVTGAAVGLDRTQALLDALAIRIKAIIQDGWLMIEGLLNERRKEWSEFEIAVNLNIADTLYPKEKVIAVADYTLPATLAAWVVGGFTFSGWMAQSKTSALTKVMASIKQGLVDGKNFSAIAKKLNANELTTLRRHIGLLSRVSMSGAAEAARNSFTDANAEWLQWWAYISVLDSITSEECRDLHGRIFRVGEGPKPPRHPHCRATSLPLRTRMNIPNETIRGWLGRQSGAVQREILGDDKLEDLDDTSLKRKFNIPRTMRHIRNVEDF